MPALVARRVPVIDGPGEPGRCLRSGDVADEDRGLSGAALRRPGGAVRPAYAARKLGPAAQLKESGVFRSVSEVSLRHADVGNAQRMMDAAYSIGGTKALVASGVSEDQLGLTRLREVCAQEIPDECVWQWTYLVRLAVV